MEFLLKKDSSGKTTTTIKEISEMLALANMKKEVAYLKSMAEQNKRSPKLTKETILALLEDYLLAKGEIINITGAASIEKLKEAKKGLIYYNPSTDKVRINTKSGWKTLKLEDDNIQG